VGVTGFRGLLLWASQVFAVCAVGVTGLGGLWVGHHRFGRFVGVKILYLA